MPPNNLRQRWRALWFRVGLEPKGESVVYNDLEMRYTEDGRRYHVLPHIRDMLNEFDDRGRELAQAPDAVEMAIWFHDAVYDTRHGSRSEERSAALAVQILSRWGAKPDFIRKVRDLILATTHRSVPDEPDAQLLVCLDLAILGASEQVFDRYEEGIREEYRHVDLAVFREVRAGILERFLKRPAIYVVPKLRRRYEAQARRNLKRSIRKLRGPLS